MSSTSRGARRLLIVALLLATLAVGSTPRNAQAKNTVHVDNDSRTITITVNATLVGNPEKVAFILQAFNSYWGMDGYTYRCYKVKMVLNIEAGSGPQGGTHTINMVATQPGDPWVSTVSFPRDFRPADQSATGRWSDWDDANIVAHEFGHMFGLPDEYSYVDKNRNGKRDYDEPTMPDPNKAPEYGWKDKAPTNGRVDSGEIFLEPGRQPSLMAEWADGTSKVLQRHIDAIVNKHTKRGELDGCPWEGKGKIRETPLDDGNRKLTRSAEFDFWFDVDEDGNVAGEITLTYAAVLTVEGLPSVSAGVASFDPEVGGQVTDPFPTRTFPLTGTLDDAWLTLEIATPEAAREPIEFTIRADPGVSAGLTPGGALVPLPGASEEQVILINMTPFTPFWDPAEVESDAGGPRSARFTERGDDYEIEWSAERNDTAGLPVSWGEANPLVTLRVTTSSRPTTRPDW